MNDGQQPLRQKIDRERRRLLRRLQLRLELPMVVLAFVWLALFIVEAIRGLSPALAAANYVIWGVFVFEFALGFTLAPGKLGYLRHEWLKGIALLAPALRIFRLARVLRVLRLSRALSMSRGLRLLRVLSSLNRSMRALGRTMRRRGFGYVVLLTLTVTLAGAAGMYAFESNLPGGRGLNSYGTALWWTAMIMTTMGSEYWPQTAEGRVLCVVLSLYSVGVFGYVTATLATFFIGSDAEQNKSGPGTGSVEALRAEIAALRTEIGALSQTKPKPDAAR
jgi:voltage-gated potassium channel